MHNSHNFFFFFLPSMAITWVNLFWCKIHSSVRNWFLHSKLSLRLFMWDFFFFFWFYLWWRWRTSLISGSLLETVETRSGFLTEGSGSLRKAPLLFSVSEQLGASVFRSCPAKGLPLAQSWHLTPLKQREWRLPASPNVLSAFWSSERLCTGINQSRVSLFI